MDGWMDGSQSRVKDCLQQSINDMLTWWLSWLERQSHDTLVISRSRVRIRALPFLFRVEILNYKRERSDKNAHARTN